MLKTDKIKKASATPEESAQFVRDAAAFIRWWSDTGALSQGAAFATLVHDILGLDRGEDCFAPRVGGYAAREDSDGVYSSHAAAMHAQARRELYPREE
jgi:hypothetical protein